MCCKSTFKIFIQILYRLNISRRKGIWLFCFCMWGGSGVGQKQMCQISGRGLIGGNQGVIYRAVRTIH